MRKRYSLSPGLDGDGKYYNQSFFKRLGHLKAQESVEVVVNNAEKTRYPKGWVGYRPYFRCASGPWKRAQPGRLSGGVFQFDFETYAAGATEVSWYPPFDKENYQNLLTSWKSGLVCDEPLVIKSGTHKKAILIVGGQHPGESMGIWFSRYLLEAISNSALMNKFSLIVCPVLNVDGYRNNLHRFTSDGVDFNRSWLADALTAHQKALLRVCAEHDIVCAIDAHGDEVSDSIGYIASPAKVSAKDFYRYYVLGNKVSKLLKFSASKKRLIHAVFSGHSRSSRQPTMANYFSERSKISLTVELCARKTEFSEIPHMATVFTRCLEETFGVLHNF